MSFDEENRIKRYPEELTEEEIEGCIYYGEEGERIIKKLLKRIVALEDEESKEEKKMKKKVIFEEKDKEGDITRVIKDTDGLIKIECEYYDRMGDGIYYLVTFRDDLLRDVLTFLKSEKEEESFIVRSPTSLKAGAGSFRFKKYDKTFSFGWGGIFQSDTVTVSKDRKEGFMGAANYVISVSINKFLKLEKLLPAYISKVKIRKAGTWVKLISQKDPVKITKVLKGPKYKVGKSSNIVEKDIEYGINWSKESNVKIY